MAPWGGSTPRGAQVVDPAGAGHHWLPVGVGGRTGWSGDVREAAVEKGGGSAPARTQPLPRPPPAGQGADCRGLSHWQRRRSCFQRRGPVTAPRERWMPEGLGVGPRLSWGHSQVGGILLADVLLQDTGVYVGGLQGSIDVVACRGGADVSWGGVQLGPRPLGPALQLSPGWTFQNIRPRPSPSVYPSLWSRGTPSSSTT